ncbi:hypothetical protein P148_SR1C00001G1029 [candidate division SR1 bacterium RAAC1_SR1_1]|nr:hypothetical protein P148_SR1C00001G1029 [candidate division SR1 bacterium RAAC1_SR1_1]
MTKRLLIIFFITLAYFLIIIPVQSQQQDTGEQQNIYENNSGSGTTGENTGEIIQEIPTNDTGQNIQIEENISGSNNVTEVTENLSGNNFTNDTTGQNTQINQAPQLIISEIYYDGTEEWIEITNLGSYFSGEVEMRTPQSNFFTLSLQPNQSIILTKSSQLYSRISPLVIQKALPLSFSFTDTKAIFTTLSRSGQTIDTFQAETGLVTKYNDKKTSLIKQYNNQIWFITGSTSAINVLSPYIASPGIWESGDAFQTNNGDSFGTGTLGISGTLQTGGISNTGICGALQSGGFLNTGILSFSGTGDSGCSSGSDLGGGGMTGHVQFPIASSPQPGILSITEIYQSTGFFSDFIEIQALQDFSGKIFFSGSLLKTSFNLDFSGKNQDRTIIVYSDNGWLSGQKKIKEVSLDLNTSGCLQALGQSGQVFDSIQVLASSGNKSNYNGDFSNGDIDIFSKIDDFSPGFDEQFLVYFSAIYTYTTGQIIQNTGFSDQINSGGLSTGTTQNGQDLSGTSTTGITIKPKDLQITALTHKTPESITIKSNITFNIDLSKKDRYLLTKETPTSDRKITKKYLTGILGSGQFTTIFKTRGFLDAGSCVGLFYQTGQLDEWCYGSALPKPEEEPVLEDDIPNIQIIGVLPNPVGKDDKEELHLLRTPSTTGSVVMRENERIENLIFPPESLYIKINTTKKYLTASLLANQITILTGSLGLVNKAACIELRYTTNLLDTFCYPDPLEGEFIPRGGRPDIPEYFPSIKILGALPNPQGKDDTEFISLLRTPSTSGSVTEGSAFSGFVSGNESIQNFLLPPKTLYLLNNKTKTYFSGSLQANTGTIFKSSLGLLNSAHCTELRYATTQLDRFCYPNPKEDEYFGTGNILLQTLQKSDFSLLQKVGFIVTGSQICVRYYDQMLTCRQLPAAKTSIKLKNENKLYKTYVGLIQNYLIKNWSTLYFNTPITDYFTVLKNAKAQVKDFSSTINISGQRFDVYDISGQIELTTATQGLSGKQSQDQKSWLQKFLIWLGI